MIDETQEEEDAFVGYNEWATTALHVTFCTAFVYDYADGERGVFVAEDIAPQTCILRVPFESLLTLEWIAHQVHHGHPIYSSVALFRSLTQDDWDVEREDDVLALALLYERFVARDKSRWHEHLDRVPKSYDNLLYWTDAQLESLRGSNVFSIAQQMQAKVKSDYGVLESTAIHELSTAVRESIDSATDITTNLDDYFALNAYQWALSTIWSRFVSVEVSASKFPVLKAMAPVFDMLNHDPGADVTHGFNKNTRCLEVTTHDHVSAGTQLCIHYGPLSNQKLLTLYGFVVDDNPFDSVEMWLAMDPDTTPRYAAKAASLLALGIDHESFVYELCGDDDWIEDTLLLAARVIALPPEDEPVWGERIETIKSGRVMDSDHEVHALCLLIDHVRSLLNAYPTTGKQAQVTDRRRAMARIVCDSDQRILRQTLGTLETMLVAALPLE